MLLGLVTSDLLCFNSWLRGPVAQRLEQGTHNPLVPGSNPGGPKEISDCRLRIVDLKSVDAPTSRHLHRACNSECADPGGALRELSGCLFRWEYLFHRCRLLCAHDARAIMRGASGLNRASPRFRKFPGRDNAAHDRAARLSHRRVVDLAPTFYRACA